MFFSRDNVAGTLVPPESAELSAHFLEALPQPARSVLRAVSAGALRPLGKLLERVTVPGIQLHYAVRKLHIEQTARRFIREGGEQVVVLAAGFDTLAIRLAKEYPQVRFVEVDRAATQQHKTAALRELAPLDNLLFLPLELSSDRFVEALVSRAELNSSARTIFLAEGLLMYLSAASVEALFADVAQLAAPGDLFVFTFMEPDDGGRVTFRNQGKAVNLWLSLRGEQFAWGMRRERIADFILPRGFRATEIATSEELRARYLPHALSLPLAAGECVCVSERV